MTVVSELAEARVLLSGLKATEVTASVCPLNMASDLPLLSSQKMTEVSTLAEARV